MQTPNVNNEIFDFDMTLNFHRQDVSAKEIEKVDRKTSKKATAGELAAKDQNLGGSPHSAPVVGNLFFQVCGGVESTLAALQAVVFGNEQKLMESGTEIAKSNFTMQGAESQTAYTASVLAGQKSEQQMKLNCIQSFTTAGVTLGGVGVQFVGSKMSGSNQKLDELKVKLGHQEELSKLTQPSTEDYMTSLKVSDDASLSIKGKTVSDAMKARAQDLIANGGTTEYKLPSNEKFADLKEFDDATIKNMSPSEKIAAHKAIGEQIKTTKQEINTAESEASNVRQMIQTGVQLATQVVTGSVQGAQAPVAYQQKLQEAVASMEGQAFQTSSANAQLAAKMREQAADEGKNTVAAIMSAVATANGRA